MSKAPRVPTKHVATKRAPTSPLVHNRIKGRFGNQLFQFWLGKWVSQNTGMPLETYNFNEWYLDKYYFPNLGSFKMAKKYRLIPDKQTDNDKKTYMIYNHHMEIPMTLDPDQIINECKAAAPGRSILMSAYNETYKYIRKHESWIKSLYARSTAVHSAPLPIIAIHMRLGDLATHYQPSHDDYKAFCTQICKKHPNLDIVICSEQPCHRMTRDLVRHLKNSDATIAHRLSVRPCTENTVQEDFDVFCRAQVLALANSTFTWWAAFLNPFQPKVYVALSKTQPHQVFRNPNMFVKGPRNWHIWDMDTKHWLR